MGSWDELTRCSSRLLVGDVVPGDVCGGRLPGEGNGGRGQRCELQIGGSLDNWFNCGGEFRTLDHQSTFTFDFSVQPTDLSASHLHSCSIIVILCTFQDTFCPLFRYMRYK